MKPLVRFVWTFAFVLGAAFLWLPEEGLSAPPVVPNSKGTPGNQIKFEFRSPALPVRLVAGSRYVCDVRFSVPKGIPLPDVVVVTLRRDRDRALGGQQVGKPSKLNDGTYQCLIEMKAPPASGKFTLSAQTGDEFSQDRPPPSRVDVEIE